jgi:hypothetical protein
VEIGRSMPTTSIPASRSMAPNLNRLPLTYLETVKRA